MPASTKKPNPFGEQARLIFDQFESRRDQWREHSFPDPNSISCSSGDHANVDAVCNNADAWDVGSTCGHEELGRLACSTRVLVLVHSMVRAPELARSKELVLEPEQRHSKVLEQVLVHSMEQGLEQVQARNKVRALAQVHSKELVQVLAHSMEQELALEHNMAREQVHSMAQALGSKLACSNDALVGYANAQANLLALHSNLVLAHSMALVLARSKGQGSSCLG